MPITFVIDELIHDFIMEGEFEKAKALALAGILKELREIRGYMEAIVEDGVSCNKTVTKEKQQ